MYKNIKNLQNYNFVFCFIWVWNPSPTWREDHTRARLANWVFKKTFEPRVVGRNSAVKSFKSFCPNEQIKKEETCLQDFDGET